MATALVAASPHDPGKVELCRGVVQDVQIQLQCRKRLRSLMTLLMEKHPTRRTPRSRRNHHRVLRKRPHRGQQVSTFKTLERLLAVGEIKNLSNTAITAFHACFQSSIGSRNFIHNHRLRTLDARCPTGIRTSLAFLYFTTTQHLLTTLAISGPICS